MASSAAACNAAGAQRDTAADGADMNPMLELMLTRRSVKALELGEPGPDEATLSQILRAGIRAPDHGKLGPWRLVVFSGDARERFGEVLVRAFERANPDAPEGRSELERGRLARAPVVVAVISSVTPEHKIPEWEQVLSAGAVCENLLLATHAAGFRAQWITEWYAYDPTVREALGCGEHERVAGWIYMGSADFTPEERARPELEQVVQWWR